MKAWTTAPLTPFSSVTPFTVRDGATYLDILSALVKWSKTVSPALEEHEKAIHELQEGMKQVVTDLAWITQEVHNIRRDMNAMYQELLNAIHKANDEGTAYNPVYGTYGEPMSKVLGDIYDHCRPFAWRATQLDNLDLTAAEFDALSLSARQFDLAPNSETKDLEA